MYYFSTKTDMRVSGRNRNRSTTSLISQPKRMAGRQRTSRISALRRNVSPFWAVWGQNAAWTREEPHVVAFCTAWSPRLAAAKGSGVNGDVSLATELTGEPGILQVPAAPSADPQTPPQVSQHQPPGVLFRNECDGASFYQAWHTSNSK